MTINTLSLIEILVYGRVKLDIELF